MICDLFLRRRVLRATARIGWTARNAVRHPRLGAVPVLAFELAQECVAALGRPVQRELGRHLPVPYAFEFLLEDRPDLREGAEADAARLACRVDQEQLADRDFVARVGLVEAAPLRLLVSGLGDRYVAGALVPFGLHLGPRKPGEEARDAAVLGRFFPRHSPQRGAADQRVARRAADVVVIR